MKSGRLTWGIILLLTGVLVLLKRLDVIEISWLGLLAMWPVLLITIGLSMLPIQSWIKTILVVSTFILALFFMPDGVKHDSLNWSFSNWECFNSDDSDYENGNSFKMTENYNSDIKYGELNLDAVANDLIISETAQEMIEVTTYGGTESHYKLKTNEDLAAEKQYFTIYLKNEKFHPNNGDIEVRLHPKVEWTIKIDAAAADIDLDLHDLKIGKISFDGAASDIELKLGSRQQHVELDFNSAAADIEVEIPLKMACRIVSESIISDMDCPNLIKISRGIYETEGFADAKQKVEIDLDCVASSFSVDFY